MAALITFADLQARPGFAHADQAQAESLIGDVSALVQQIAGPAVLDAATLPPVLMPVIVSMVRRGLDNPLGVASEQTGGWMASGRAGVYATRAERKVIRRAVGKLGVGTAGLEGNLPLPNDLYAAGVSPDDLTGTL